MSAFIVADKTINRIVNWLDKALEEAYGTISIRQKLLEMGFDANVTGWTERLGYAMFQLNVINDVQLYLMTEIIDTLPEYQNAHWG